MKPTAQKPTVTKITIQTYWLVRSAQSKRTGQDSQQDEEAAHGGRALLRLVAFGAIAADGLALALALAQPADHRCAEQQCNQQAGRETERHAEGDETEKVQLAAIGRQ